MNGMKDIEPKNVSKDQSVGHKVGDAIERAGEALKKKGADKVGQAVYDAGNKLEHTDENDADVDSEVVDRKNDSF